MIIQISGYRVLFLAPGKAKSHFIFVSPFVRTLLDRGHKVTYLTSNTLNLNMTSYSEILLNDVPTTIGTSNERYINIYLFVFSQIFQSFFNYNFHFYNFSSYSFLPLLYIVFFFNIFIFFLTDLRYFQSRRIHRAVQ